MPRPNVICSRFSDEEAAKIDRLRKSLNRAEWVRWIVLRELRKEEA